MKLQKKVSVQTAESIEMLNTIALSLHQEAKELRARRYTERADALSDIAYALNNGIKAYIEKG